MCLRSKVSSALIVTLGLFSPILLADAGQFYVAPGVQRMDFGNSTNLNSDNGYFFSLGYDVTDRSSIEFSTFDLDSNIPNNTDVDHYKLDLLYNFDVNLGMFDTFAVGGFGNSDIGGDSDALWDIGAGIKYKLADNWTWRTAVRSYQYLNRDREDNDWGIDTSLVYRFGGKQSRPANRAASTPASTPASRPVEQPPAAPVTDSDVDRDGVPDSRDNCPDTPRNYAVDADGCPIPSEEIARIELMVNFDFDRSEVKQEYYSEIEEVANFMRQYPDVVVELEGYTDSRGTEQYNLDLSGRRATAVRQLMIDQFNVQASRISARGFGESQPAATNDTDVGRAENRRVITVIVKTLQNYRPR